MNDMHLRRTDDMRHTCVAIPKGRLFESTIASLSGLGITATGDRSYRCASERPDVTARIVKARAIPQLVAHGIFDAGFCGIDLIREAGVEEYVVPVADLNTERVQLVVAAARASILESPPKRPLVIATEYPHLASAWAMGKGLAHIVLQTYGATEGYVPEAADLVVDCVATGATLEANGLVVIDRIGESSTHLVVNRRRWNTGGPDPIVAAVWASMPSPGAAVMVAVGDNPENKVLTVYVEGQGRGLGLPGGLVEDDQTPLVTAIREMEEETGLRPTGVVRQIYQGVAGRHGVAVFCTRTDGEPRSSEEGVAAWSDPSELLGVENKYRHFNALSLNATGVRVGLP